MSRLVQFMLAVLIVVAMALGLAGCGDGKGSSRTPRMTKIVFKGPIAVVVVGDTTATPITLPSGDSAYCSPTDLIYSASDTTLRARARIYNPITGAPPYTRIIETTQPLPVGIICE